MNNQNLISYFAIFISLITLIIVYIRMKLMSKDLKTKNYQNLLSKIIAQRESIIRNPKIGEIFVENPDIKNLLTKANVTIEQFYLILNYMTVFENFFYQRRKGVMGNQTWEAYKSTLTIVLNTPKVKKLWIEMRQLATYRKDWINFINCIVNGEEIKDPKLSFLQRQLKTLKNVT